MPPVASTGCWDAIPSGDRAFVCLPSALLAPGGRIQIAISPFASP